MKKYASKAEKGRARRRLCKERGLCTCGGQLREGRTDCQNCAEAKRRYHRRKVTEFLNIIGEKYGKVCRCCGESKQAFLTLDHIAGGGGKHRKEIGINGGVNFYKYLIKHNLPDGYETLCFNCNVGRYRNGGICPHIQEMNVSLIKTPFKDTVGMDSVPKHGNAGGKYDAPVAPDVPGRDKSPNGLDELTFDTHAGDPKLSGPVKSIYKDAVD